ncbi:hypothetical protein [Pseudarthrobacter chlorophenolicus]|uniref:hypothetical protein n=1 Tax=Pseudarthrobacter chlorophenolicus TaxID=85085 RepID=UPI0009F270C1|nr:hypothetical protein [Pseudarthrobacter chlorophenolicus]
MVDFSWMRSKGPRTRPTAHQRWLSFEPEALPAQEAAAEFVYNPWKLKELRRLYVNLPDGTKIGYLDLATMDVCPGVRPDAGTPAAGAWPAVSGRIGAPLHTAAQEGPALIKEDEAILPAHLPWKDLAANRPGQRIEHMDDDTYRAGVAGEQRTAGVLAILERRGYQVLHSLPLSPRKDLTTWSLARRVCGAEHQVNELRGDR